MSSPKDFGFTQVDITHDIWAKPFSAFPAGSTIVSPLTGYNIVIGSGWATEDCKGGPYAILAPSGQSELDAIVGGLIQGSLKYGLMVESMGGGAAMNGDIGGIFDDAGSFATDTDSGLTSEIEAGGQEFQEAPSSYFPSSPQISEEGGAGEAIGPQETLTDPGMNSQGEDYNAVIYNAQESGSQTVNSGSEADHEVATDEESNVGESADDATSDNSAKDDSYDNSSLAKNLASAGKGLLSSSGGASSPGNKQYVAGYSKLTSTTAGQLMNSRAKPKTGLATVKTISQSKSPAKVAGGLPGGAGSLHSNLPLIIGIAALGGLLLFKGVK